MNEACRITAGCVVAIGLAGHAAAAEQDEVKDCPAAEIAAARSFMPTAVQLKSFVDATVDLQLAARKDPALAEALRTGKETLGCRLDESMTVLGEGGATTLFARQPAVARIYASHGVSARLLGRWSIVALPMALSTDPQFGRFAKEALSPQQAAFAAQQTAELQRFLKATPRPE